jgi:tocopherol O-methyltransferase
MDEHRELREAIRDHYDQLSFFYRLFWGDHIHHGYWEGDETPAVAQDRLIERLAQRAGVPRGARVLDVGCGLGGSSRWLARHLGCSVLGITLSPVQASAAAQRARDEGLGALTEFRVLDANQLDLPAARFDVVWVIECSEHLQDKPAFFRNCARVLRGGGRLALCAWLAGDRSGADLVAEVCHGMLCPSLGTLEEHRHWLEDAGFVGVDAEDITRQVEKTWELCEAILEGPEVKPLLSAMDARTRDFLDTFGTMRRAYATGAMRYGMITGKKWSADGSR